MRILYVTATVLEEQALKEVKGISRMGEAWIFGDLYINPLVAGIGSVSTTYEMLRWIIDNGKPDMAINAGVAGSFNEQIKEGEVVMPVRECFADIGIEDNGRFLTLAEAGLSGNNESPFSEDWITADENFLRRFDYLKPVISVTVNTATGSNSTRDRLVRKFNPDIETMEGASFFYICRRERIPFLAVRSISNRIEARNRENWKMKLAIENLSARLQDIFLTLGQEK